MRFILTFVVLASACFQQAEASWKFASPSGNLITEVKVADNKLLYCINIFDEGKEANVLPFSPLGLVRNDASFAENLKVDSVSVAKSINESYEMVSGKQVKLAYKANEYCIYASNQQGKKINIVFRIFDDGVGFRYIFPDADNSTYSILSEQTGFVLPENANGWMSPYERSNNYGQPGYELDYLAVKAGMESPDSIGWAFPLLFKTDKCWLFISETALDENYCGTHTCNKGNLYTIAFPESNERYGKGSSNPSSQLPWKMPWRYIVVGKTIQQVYASSLGYHLADPSVIKDVSWIKPGVSAWEWWSSTSGRNVPDLKKFINLASEMGWEYSLIDGGWPKMPDGSLEELIAYAKPRNVGLTIWYNSGGRRDTTQKDEDFVLFNDDTRKKELERISKMGFKGIKVDFFASDKQYVIKLYLDILKDAAKYNLFVNFHGCTLPRGWSRTYPNLLSMEAVKGTEAYRFSRNYPDMAARYNTIAPLVRGMAGPADYTPVTVTNQKYPRKTTLAHELATAIIYESGLIHMADKPEGYAVLPQEARDYLKRLPAVWDESRLIEAIPGQILVVARKYNSRWYIAGVNGTDTAQKVKFNLPEKIKNFVVLSDSNSLPNVIDITKHGNVFTDYEINLLPRGGLVIYQ